MRAGLEPILFAVPRWRAGASVAFDFTQNRAWRSSITTAAALLTTTRASTADYADNNAGIWSSFGANIPRITNKGLLVEEIRTNLALWCRDLTNAAWAKVTMTTAKTATGIDGVANSATTCTAAGALSTILQTVVQVSTADTVSFFVKRRTGTGTVEVTADGAAFTDITANLAAAGSGWYRAVISATLVNPVLGLRITTDTDAVDVDFAQLEAGTFVTSPILTTTVAVARAADTITRTVDYYAAGTMFVEVLSAAGHPGNQVYANLSDGTANERHSVFRTSTPTVTNQTVVGGVATASLSTGTLNDNSIGRMALAWATNNFAACLNGGAVGTDVSGAVPVGTTTLEIGSGLTTFSGAYIRRFALFPFRQSNAYIQSTTA